VEADIALLRATPQPFMIQLLCVFFFPKYVDLFLSLKRETLLLKTVLILVAAAMIP